MLPATAFCKNGLPRRCIAAFGDTVAKGQGAKGILPRRTPMCPSSGLFGIHAEATVHQTAPHGIAQCVSRKPPTVHLGHLPKGANVKERDQMCPISSLGRFINMPSSVSPSVFMSTKQMSPLSMNSNKTHKDSEELGSLYFDLVF
jgi:hypothetical protein